MKKGLTEIAFILDRSGSMRDVVSDTIGGYNSVLERQKELPGEALVTTVLFDHRYELLHDRINLKGVAPITREDYYVRGTTALLDAVGHTITKLDNAQAHTADAERPEKTLVVIITDGLENASREYTLDVVRKLVEAKKEAGWEFLFLGANIDSFSSARSFGIDDAHTSNRVNDGRGQRAMFESVDCAISAVRCSRPLTREWKATVESDYEERG